MTSRISDLETAIKGAQAQINAPSNNQAELKEAADGATLIQGYVTALRSLQKRDDEARARLSDALQLLLGIELTMTEKVERIQKGTLRKQEARLLQVETNNAIASASAILSDYARRYSSLADEQSKISLLGKEAAGLRDQISSLKLDKELKPKADNLLSLLTRAATLSEMDQASDAIGKFANDLVTLSSKDFPSAANPTASQAKIVEQLSKASRQVSTSIFYIQIVAASFMDDPRSDVFRRLTMKSGQTGDAVSSLLKLGLGAGLIQKATLDTALKSLSDTGAELTAINDEKRTRRLEVGEEIDRSWQALTRFAELQKQVAKVEGTKANNYSAAATAIGVLAAIIGAAVMIITLKGPIIRITSAMRRLADGRLDTNVVGETRSDEIGEMARALAVFKTNAVSKERVELESAEHRRQTDVERSRYEAEKESLAQEINRAVIALGNGLERLAKGDLSEKIKTPFTSQLEQLRLDFNASIERLHGAMFEIRYNADEINDSGLELQSAAHALAKRTEAQTAELEEVASAVEQIAATVQSSADRAKQANLAANDTLQRSGASVTIVKSTMDAMTRIEGASLEIQQIIAVIDEIAFQTNLLALNAGIEAARAGDAGKGFAVVAHEVRELAQKSADAAKQIKELTENASREVETGASLISETKNALDSINAQIRVVTHHISDIATATHEQAAAIAEVNASVSQLDIVNQQNQTMVARTSDESVKLAEKAQALTSLVGRFTLNINQGWAADVVELSTRKR
ncbi:methyl-accepting chemotaxis protein (plasmid) [Rhizobium sp. RCAM05350]|nr:methyl-accepting chemotaxis protein [Rhizobium sp. RCAM05350]